MIMKLNTSFHFSSIKEVIKQTEKINIEFLKSFTSSSPETTHSACFKEKKGRKKIYL